MPDPARGAEKTKSDDRRAPVQADHSWVPVPAGHNRHGPGTVAWAEHVEAWTAYAARYGKSQSAERLAERGGFCCAELFEFLGREPRTWEPRKVRR